MGKALMRSVSRLSWRLRRRIHEDVPRFKSDRLEGQNNFSSKSVS
jgi:hypothetical protein